MASVEALMALPSEEIIPNIRPLLEWLRDINWPVAGPVAKLLSRHGNELIEPIREVLNSDDAIWKNWVLSELLCHTASSVRLALSEEIERIIEQPTDAEKDEEVVESARDIRFLITHNDRN